MQTDLPAVGFRPPPAMNLLFPCEPFSPRRVEPDFASEYEAAGSAGFPCFLNSHEDLERGEIAIALKALPDPGEERRVLIRGWMVPGERYRSLHDGLLARGNQPQTPPEAHDEAHYLPLAIGSSKATPRTTRGSREMTRPPLGNSTKTSATKTRSSRTG